jgi:hypothetical protein
VGSKRVCSLKPECRTLRLAWRAWYYQGTAILRPVHGASDRFAGAKCTMSVLCLTIPYCRASVLQALIRADETACSQSLQDLRRRGAKAHGELSAWNTTNLSWKFSATVLKGSWRTGLHPGGQPAHIRKSVPLTKTVSSVCCWKSGSNLLACHALLAAIVSWQRQTRQRCREVRKRHSVHERYGWRAWRALIY